MSVPHHFFRRLLDLGLSKLGYKPVFALGGGGKVQIDHAIHADVFYYRSRVCLVIQQLLREETGSCFPNLRVRAIMKIKACFPAGIESPDDALLQCVWVNRLIQMLLKCPSRAIHARISSHCSRLLPACSSFPSSKWFAISSMPMGSLPLYPMGTFRCGSPARFGPTVRLSIM